MPTALIARSPARARELRKGVSVGGRCYRPEVFPPDALPRAELAVILVKGYDTAGAVKMARRLRPAKIVSLQNGLVDEVPQGISTAGAHRRRSQVVIATTGETLLPPGFEDFADTLRAAGMAARVSTEIDRVRYLKLLANVCINPVTALFRIRNGEVARAPYVGITRTLASEAADVLRVPRKRALAHVMKVAHATARNRSSMLQDIEARRRTEIGQLTGALLQIAARRRVEAPTHQAMLRIISVIERD